MTTVHDVPADVLIQRLSDYMKGNIRELMPPEWAAVVKTGSHVERAPQNPDWWYVRAASMIRKLYLNGPIGVARLRKEYGGRKRRGAKPAHFRKAGGSILRTLLQQLETAGLVEKASTRGRVVSPKGRSLLDAMSGQIKREMDRDNPDLKKY
ncbi:MAG: 30S ribosomal protein S19e [Candidatus Bathyarchaeota archaeon]|nr:MAG: 30S ribosomal protein S19e [Candidatus Bathyarchaeota archaeon]